MSTGINMTLGMRVNCFDTDNRYQSNNLLHWDDEEFLEFVRDESIRNSIQSTWSSERDRFKCHFVHFIDYESGGFMSYS